MGFNTVVVLFNDTLSYGALDPQIGERIQAAAQAWHIRDRVDRTDIVARCERASASYGRVLSVAHADYSQVVIVGRNTGQRACDAQDASRDALRQMAECLERHGWKVREPSRKKPAALNIHKGQETK